MNLKSNTQHLSWKPIALADNLPSKALILYIKQHLAPPVGSFGF